VAFLLFGKAPVAVTVLLLLGIPLAGWSAYASLRGLVPSKPIRIWAGATYALLPAMTGAVASGRIGLMIAAIALPIALRSLVRISGRNGTARRSAGTALIVAVVLCTTPAIWLILVAGGIAASAYLWVRKAPDARAVTGRLALSLLSPLILLLPWSWYAITHPVLLLLEPGINAPSLTDPALTPWDVLLLHPGGPGMTPIWLSALLIAAPLPARARGGRAGRASIPTTSQFDANRAATAGDSGCPSAAAGPMGAPLDGARTCRPGSGAPSASVSDHGSDARTRGC
jgi:hypothetical protein